MLGRAVTATMVCLLLTGDAQQGKAYPDGRGGEMFFPLDALSFADEIVSFTPGTPAAVENASHPEKSLGEPDYTGTVDDNYVTLGCGGSIVYRFTDNALTEVDGPDLYVFEIGPVIEPMDLAISVDAESWIDVGRIEGSTAAVDIAPFVKPGETFSYVRLTDLKQNCTGDWPGADVDAVGAIGAGRRVVLDSAVLFAVDESTLKPEAEAALLKLADEIKGYQNVRAIVEGHTDDTGSDAHNLTLSRARAEAVRRFLVERRGIAAGSVEHVGYGESRPAVPNDSDANRARNRRVEVVIIAGGGQEETRSAGPHAAATRR